MYIYGYIGVCLYVCRKTEKETEIEGRKSEYISAQDSLLSLYFLRILKY